MPAQGSPRILPEWPAAVLSLARPVRFKRAVPMSSPSTPSEATPPTEAAQARELHLLDLATALARAWRSLTWVPIAGGALAFGLASLLPPSYTARTSMLPPQQQQQAGLASALAALGPLAALGTGGGRSPAEQLVALVQSDAVADRLIDRFDLMSVYESEYRVDARNELRGRARVTSGKKDGLILIEVSDRDPQRAANLANAHVEELRRISSEIAVTEAQQRRKFFEEQLQVTRDRLAKAQTALESSGFSQGALKSDPRAAAEGYARLRADVANAEVRVQALRSYLTENAPTLRQALETLQALRAQLARAESLTANSSRGADYVSKYREFKYQETLFDLFARQYEMARVDESREGALIQVVDAAQPPEKRSGPRKVRIAAGSAVVIFMLLALRLVARQVWLHVAADPAQQERVRQLREAWRRKPGRRTA